MKYNVNQSQSNLYKVYIESVGREEINDELEAGKIEMFANRINIPGISVPIAFMSSPVNQIPFPAQAGLKVDSLVLNMICDDRLENYLEILAWVKRNTDQMTVTTPYLSAGSDTSGIWKPRDYRNITIIMKTTNNIDFAKFVAYDCFPTMVGPLPLTTQSSDQLECAVTFSCVTFEWQTLAGVVFI